MAETDEPSQTAFARSASVVSRFNEQFSDSSGSISPTCTQSCQVDQPQHIRKRLRAEGTKQKKCLLNAVQKPCKKQRMLAQERTRRVLAGTVSAYENRKIVAKEMVDRYRHRQKACKNNEKEHKQKSPLSGTMWGYDPMAGRVSETYNAPTAYKHVHGCYIFRGARNEGDSYGVDKIDSLGRRTSRQWLQGSKWGIEFGGPGRAPHFECNQSMQDQEEDDTYMLRRKRTQRRSPSPWSPLRRSEN